MLANLQSDLKIVNGIVQAFENWQVKVNSELEALRGHTQELDSKMVKMSKYQDSVHPKVAREETPHKIMSKF